jgi:hypothetical protein
MLNQKINKDEALELFALKLDNTEADKIFKQLESLH